MAYDNICKILAEEYATDFARWLLCAEPQAIEVLKTELSLDPISADALTLLQNLAKFFILNFKRSQHQIRLFTLRMLDYWVRLYRKYRRPVRQFLIFLKETNSEAVFTEEFAIADTRHRYRVIRLWEQDPAIFLSNPALLPFASLARTNSPFALLEQVATQVATIEDIQQRQNISAAVQILAGLRFDSEELISQLFGEDIMRESVIYQRILREGVQIGKQEGRQEGKQEGVQIGKQEGKQEGRQEGEASILIRLLNRRFGSVELTAQEQILNLTYYSLRSFGRCTFRFF